MKHLTESHVTWHHDDEFITSNIVVDFQTSRAHRPHQHLITVTNADGVRSFITPPTSCVRECHALLNLTLQFRHHLVEPHLLVRGQFAEGEYLLDPVLPDSHGRREEGRVREGALNERALDDAFAPDRLEEVFREDVSRVRHGEGGASGAGLRRHDLVASEFCVYVSPIIIDNIPKILSVPPIGMCENENRDGDEVNDGEKR